MSSLHNENGSDSDWMVSLTQNSKVSLGLGLVMVSGILWIQATMSSLGNNLDQVNADLTNRIESLKHDTASQIQSLKTQVEKVKKSQYTTTQASEYALRFAISNPKARVPDPRNPNTLIVVYKNGIATQSSGHSASGLPPPVTSNQKHRDAREGAKRIDD